MSDAARQPDDPPTARALRRAVRETYARAATCAGSAARGAAGRAAHSGLGCGSPVALARIRAGEAVLDLGSGAGFDCIAAAIEVGSRGRVVGVDMTPEMLRLARRSAAAAGVAIVAFVRGEIERLPFRAGTFDVVVSNCVINLCADKARVLAEAARVLKPHGRLAVADIVALAPLPAEAHADLALRGGCVAGATSLRALPDMLRTAGFDAVKIEVEPSGDELLEAWAPGLGLQRFVAAANITATRASGAPGGCDRG